MNPADHAGAGANGIVATGSSLVGLDLQPTSAVTLGVIVALAAFLLVWSSNTETHQ